MEHSAAAATPHNNAQDAHPHFKHQHLHPKHSHDFVPRRLKRKREFMEKRQSNDIVQTALDVIVVSSGNTVGDVLLGSIPSNPTTASLPGFGPLTLSSFIPSAPTQSSSGSAPLLTTPAAAAAPLPSSHSSPAATAPANATAATPSMTGVFNGTTTSPASSATHFTFSSGMPLLNSTLSSTLASSASNNLTSTSTTPSSSSSFTLTSFMTSASSSSLTSSAFTSSSTGAGIIGGGAGGPAATSTTGSAPTAAASSNSANPQAGPIAGGVIGGVAGAAILAALVFLLIRWYRNKEARGQQLLGDGADEETRNAPANSDVPSSPMTQRSSFAPIAAAVRRFRPDSVQTAGTSSTATGGAGPSERGFQKMGGRKLTSVLQSGGDGFTEPGAGPSSLQPPPAAYGANRDSNLSGTSFYRDSNSHYGGSRGDSALYEIPPEVPEVSAAAMRHRNLQAAPSGSSLAGAPPTSNRTSLIYESARTGNPFTSPADRGLAAFSTSPGSESSDGIRSPTPDIAETLTYNSGPSRTPVITGGNSPQSPPQVRRPGHGPDGLGRSRPSWDGSSHSRFSEAI